MSHINSILLTGNVLATSTHVDFTLDGWMLELLRSHPLYNGSMKFPGELLDNFHVIFGMLKTGKIVTPDGKVVREWKKEPRGSLLANEKGKEELYEMFKVMTENTLRLNYDGVRKGGDVKTSITFLTFNTMHVRHKLSDEQLLRFQQEYWREMVYEMLAKKAEDALKGKLAEKTAAGDGENAVQKGDGVKDEVGGTKSDAKDEPKDIPENEPKDEGRQEPEKEPSHEQRFGGLVPVQMWSRANTTFHEEPKNEAKDEPEKDSKTKDVAAAPVSDSRVTLTSIINGISRLMQPQDDDKQDAGSAAKQSKEQPHGAGVPESKA